MTTDNSNPVTDNVGTGASSKNWFFIHVRGVAGAILLQSISKPWVEYLTEEEVLQFNLNEYAGGIVAGNLYLYIDQLLPTGKKQYRSDLAQKIKERLQKKDV